MTNLVLILVTALPIATVVGRKIMMNYGRRSRLQEALQMTFLLSKVRQACTTKKTLNIIQIECLTVITALYKDFIYSENMPEMNWNLVAGDTLILDNPCKKAECTFRGRTWYAWYAMSIPIHDATMETWRIAGYDTICQRQERTVFL